MHPLLWIRRALICRMDTGCCAVEQTDFKGPQIFKGLFHSEGINDHSAGKKKKEKEKVERSTDLIRRATCQQLNCISSTMIIVGGELNKKQYSE